MTRSSAIDRRIASALHQHQIEAIIRSESAADAVDREINRAGRDFLASVTDGDAGAAAAILRSAVATGRDTLAEQFRRLAYWSHGDVTRVFAATIPRRWYRKSHPRLSLLDAREDHNDPNRFPSPLDPDQLEIPGQAIGPIQGDPLTADITSEPIARGERMSDEEWERVVSRVVMPPPSREEVERIIELPTAGLSWQERFESLSRKITNPEALAQHLITGYAQGESLAALRKRIEPLVGGIKSSARRIARTEGLRVAESIQRKAWDGLGSMMLGAQILAVLDENTRPAHAARNGRIYYRDSADGSPSMSEMPTLPDEPNCRCYASPVLRPPEEFQGSPAVQADFANVSGQHVPDPAAYDKWFEQADSGRRKMAVGARRYNAMGELLGNQREPQWTDFVDSEGKLLSPQQLREETSLERAERKQAVAAALREREALLRQVAERGFAAG